jgi:hypothetical protein
MPTYPPVPLATAARIAQVNLEDARRWIGEGLLPGVTREPPTLTLDQTLRLAAMNWLVKAKVPGRDAALILAKQVPTQTWTTGQTKALKLTPTGPVAATVPMFTLQTQVQARWATGGR